MAVRWGHAAAVACLVACLAQAGALGGGAPEPALRPRRESGKSRLPAARRLRGGVTTAVSVRDLLADLGWGQWLAMAALEDCEATTMVVKLSASLCFLCSSVVCFPEVNWPSVAMQLVMLAINARRARAVLGLDRDE